LEAHEGEVTKLMWLDKEATLLTAGKDKCIKVIII
jgi:hypothetical protein